jgi:glycosyltransferase involved in cell wall biosynthesis
LHDLFERRTGDEQMGRIKVLHIVGGGEFGGAEQHLLTLIKKIDRSEFELHIACLFAEPLAPLVDKEGFPAHIFPMQSKFDWKPIGNLASLIKTEGFHIVHTHGVRANLIGRLAAKRAGVSHIVTTVHSVLAFDYNRLPDRLINRLCEYTTRGLTERFITVCDKLAVELTADGVPKEKIFTIHNGLELEKYNPDISGDPIRQEFGIAEDRIVMGIIARLHPVKGHTYLLEALALAVKKVPGLLLMIVGTGPDRAMLEEKCRELALGNNVVFTGFRRDVPAILASLDFLVLPSLSEGLSLTIMEGMAMKKPVLATAVGGTPEIISHQVDGYLVPPADADALAAGILRMSGEPEKVRDMGLAARRTIEERFTAAIMADKTTRIYRSLI